MEDGDAKLACVYSCWCTEMLCNTEGLIK